MKLKFLLLSIFLIGCVIPAQAADDAGLRFVQTRGTFICGSDLNIGTYAYKNEDDDTWQGIDADLCRALASATVGRADNIVIKHVDANEVGKALREAKIDVMLGFAPYSANVELNKEYTPAVLTYYDKQMFLAFDLKGAKSMEDFRGKRVCAVLGTEDVNNVEEYSNKYGLELKVHFYKTEREARTAFLTKRCELLTGNEMQLKGILKKYGETSKLVLIPETIAVKPVYAFVDFKNDTLRVAIKWIVNALMQAERKDINANNIDVYVFDNNSSTKNLLGKDPKLWKKFGVQPGWMNSYIKQYGNYRDLINRNIPNYAKENNLTENGGAINPLSFL